MILHEFPNLQWLKKQADERFSNRKAWDGRALETAGWPTVILNTRTKGTVRDNIKGPLSIFTNLSGQSSVTADSKRVTIKEGFFFLTNAQQHYSLEIDHRRPAETFNIHFGDYFAERVWSSLSQTPEDLLENKGASEGMEFRNRLVPLSQTTRDIIWQLHTARPEGMMLEEKLFALMNSLIAEEKNIRKAQEQLPALKSSTRKEIIQRLLAATDYIYTYYDQKISLDELARECYLSKFHFLRLFKIAFNKTPYQFINGVRVQHAQQLLLTSRLEVKEIAHLTGFDSSATFSRMFYNQSGVYPSQFRGR